MPPPAKKTEAESHKPEREEKTSKAQRIVTCFVVAPRPRYAVLATCMMTSGYGMKMLRTAHKQGRGGRVMRRARA